MPYEEEKVRRSLERRAVKSREAGGLADAEYLTPEPAASPRATSTYTDQSGQTLTGIYTTMGSMTT